MKRKSLIDSLVAPLVEHLMSGAESTLKWRNELIKQRVLSTDEVGAADDMAIRLAYKAMKTIELSHLSEEKLMEMIESQQMNWSVHLPEDIQQGAICY